MKKSEKQKKELTVRVMTPISKERAQEVIKEISKMINLKYSNVGE